MVRSQYPESPGTLLPDLSDISEIANILFFAAVYSPQIFSSYNIPSTSIFRRFGLLGHAGLFM